MQVRTPRVGDLLGGKYLIVRSLGDGGMGTVFEAENTFTNKRVALKWLLASLAQRPEAKERLLREARAGSRVKHRNVVDTYDVGFEGDAMFLVMELLEGQTLATFLETSCVDIAAFIRLLLPALRGVAEAHRQGVIHRDIKPENIFLADEVDHTGQVAKVLDFGIAKLDGDSLRTRSGSAVGTPAFMSFEQLRGVRELDGRVDVYGFGVILYMALTGRLPYVADSLPELVYKMTVGELTPLLALRPELSPELCATVERAMNRDRAQRTPSLDRLLQELAPYADSAQELGQTCMVVYEARSGEQPALSETKPAYRPPGRPDVPHAQSTLGDTAAPEVALSSEPAQTLGRRSWPADRLRRVALVALVAIAVATFALLRLAPSTLGSRPARSLSERSPESPREDGPRLSRPEQLPSVPALRSVGSSEPASRALPPSDLANHADAGIAVMPALAAPPVPKVLSGRQRARAARALPVPESQPPNADRPSSSGARRPLSHDEFFGTRGN